MKSLYPHSEHIWEIPEKQAIVLLFFFHLKLKFSYLICCEIPARILIFKIPFVRSFFSPLKLSIAHRLSPLLHQYSWGSPGLGYLEESHSI